MKRPSPLTFLLVAVFLDMLGLGLVVPIVPALTIAVTGGPAAAARWGGLIDSSYGVLQFLAAPLLGRAADRYGRRPVLVVSVLLLGVNYLAHAAASHAWQLLVAHALAGLFAGNGIAVNAYIADVTPPDGRARAYGVVGAAAAAGFITGPAIGGLLGAVNLRLPFLVAGTVALTNAAVGLLVLPESRPGDRTTSLSPRQANPVSAGLALLRAPRLRLFTLARIGRDIARLIDQVTWVFFLQVRFGWSMWHIGVVIGGMAAVGVVLMTKAAGPVVARFGARRVAVAGGALSAVTAAALVLIPSSAYVYPLAAIDCAAGLAGTALATLIANATGPDEQGTVQGSLGGLSALAEAVVPVSILALFGASLGWGVPGLVYAVAAAASAAAVVAVLRARTATDDVPDRPAQAVPAGASPHGPANPPT